MKSPTDLDIDRALSAGRQHAHQRAQAILPFRFLPGVLGLAGTKAQAGRIFSVDAVYAELRRGEDELSRWAKAMNRREFFLDAGKVNIAPAIARLTQWVDASSFTPEATHEFNDSTDLLIDCFCESAKLDSGNRRKI